MNNPSQAAVGLYVHVPFCAHVCPYCDFAVLIAGCERRQAWVEGIATEAAQFRARGMRFDTLYLGGGTPSSLSSDHLQRTVQALNENLSIEPGAARFLEVNPEDVSSESVRRWRALGFTTVSLGVQSLDDASLRFLGRRHTADEVRRSLATLRDGGFETVSIDLIFGLHVQSSGEWRRQLDQAVAAAPDHISCYQLTIHGGTVFGKRQARGELVELDEDHQAELFLLTHQVLADGGYEGYELSNFARQPSHRSRHNLKYWRHEPYLGLGPAAHSFLDGRRWWNHRKLRLWQRALDEGRSPEAGTETLTDQQLAQEAVMLGLRTADGVDLERLWEYYGVDLLEANVAAIDRLVAENRLRLVGGRLRPTVSGMAIADTIARLLSVVPGCS
jgi:oxygen-independent coproporphyrinogen-3 oxidase